MLRQARSDAKIRNPDFIEQARPSSEGNMKWGERAAYAMKAAGPDRWTYVALLGGSDTMSFRLRLAQSHLRRDMLPSYWSEVILVELAAASIVNAKAIHVPLCQPEGPNFSTRENGVVERPLADFDDVGRFPNIALIALPVPQADILKRVHDFRRARSTLDALEHLLRWLAYAWGVARTGNPIHENYGLPSACMLETVCAAENFDLTPGLESRASCPEAIWGAARVWQDYFQQASGRVPFGRFWHPHSYPIEEPVRTDTFAAPAPAPAPRSRRKKG